MSVPVRIDECVIGRFFLYILTRKLGGAIIMTIKLGRSLRLAYMEEIFKWIKKRF